MISFYNFKVTTLGRYIQYSALYIINNMQVIINLILQLRVQWTILSLKVMTVRQPWAEGNIKII